MNLKGKKILMFSPYGTTKHYGDAIITELRKRGAIVYGYDERPSQSTIMKIFIRLFKKKVPLLFNNYCRGIINKHINVQFDYILICRGEAFTPESLSILKNAYPKAIIILFLWDILRTNNVSANIPYGDRVFSFDPDDVRNNLGLIFRPTFYIEDYKNVLQDIPRKQDLIFIGTLHSNRHLVIKKLKNFLNKNGISIFTFLFVPSIIVYLKDLICRFPYISIREVRFKPLSVPETISLLGETKAIIDINYTNQKSLSTRAFEAMAAKRKYITTNPEIQKYEFYNPNNILVVDIDNIHIPRSFIDSPFDPIPENLLYPYSVKGLVDDLFA